MRANVDAESGGARLFVINYRGGGGEIQRFFGKFFRVREFAGRNGVENKEIKIAPLENKRT